jgi:hypothetical protein
MLGRLESWQMLCRQLLFGLLSGRFFAAESVMARFLADALPPWSIGSLADALPLWSLSLLADALPPLLLNAGSLGGCFATVAWSFA